MSKGPEAQIQAAIMDYLATERILAFRNNTGAMFGYHNGKKWAVRFGVPGMADIVSYPKLKRPSGAWTEIYDGILWIEVKAPKGKQSELQKDFQKLVESHGHTYLLATSVDEVMEFLK